MHQAAWAQEKSKQREDFIPRPCKEANKQYTKPEPESTDTLMDLRKHVFSRGKMNVSDRGSENKTVLSRSLYVLGCIKDIYWISPFPVPEEGHPCS